MRFLVQFGIKPFSSIVTGFLAVIVGKLSCWGSELLVYPSPLGWAGPTLYFDVFSLLSNFFAVLKHELKHDKTWLPNLYAAVNFLLWQCGICHHLWSKQVEEVIVSEAEEQPAMYVELEQLDLSIWWCCGELVCFTQVYGISNRSRIYSTGASTSF